MESYQEGNSIYDKFFYQQKINKTTTGYDRISDARKQQIKKKD